MSILNYKEKIKQENEGPRITAQEPRNMAQGGQLVDHGPERQDYYQGRVVTRKGFPHEGEYALYRKKNRETVTKYFKNKKNPDLWKRFLKIYKNHKVKFQWIKGHNNDFYNERCDFLANLAAKNSSLLEDKGYTLN